MQKKSNGMKNETSKKRNKQVVVEANARRKVNEKWKHVASLRCYQWAATREGCRNITAMIQEECFDGILLQLYERSSSKSYQSQKRLLRRIVEKRQAQSIHRTIGRTNDRFINHIKNHSISRSVNDLNRFRFYA